MKIKLSDELTLVVNDGVAILQGDMGEVVTMDLEEVRALYAALRLLSTEGKLED